jgi:uncharacterized protein YegL
MENNVKQALLKEFKKANIERKEKLAKKFGYNSAWEYLAYLEGNDKSTKTKPKVKPVIHNVFIMDASSSMQGEKYNNGVKGIEELLESINKDTFSINTVTLIEFNTWLPSYTKQHSWLSDIKSFSPMGAHGCTPLYRVLGNIIDRLLFEDKINKQDKVLLNIVTDGDDTEGWGEYRNLPDTLKRVQKENNFTVTFVGTEYDVQRCINNLNIDRSNTLVHDNTGEGVRSAYATTVSSRTAYSKSASQGEDVTLGFYKKLIN